LLPILAPMGKLTRYPRPVGRSMVGGSMVRWRGRVGAAALLGEEIGFPRSRILGCEGGRRLWIDFRPLSEAKGH
jgi:hypothetical protein